MGFLGCAFHRKKMKIFFFNYGLHLILHVTFPNPYEDHYVRKTHKNSNLLLINLL
jgi:hypothetical protein